MIQNVHKNVGWKPSKKVILSAKYEQISSVSAAIVTRNKQVRTIQEHEIYHWIQFYHSKYKYLLEDKPRT